MHVLGISKGYEYLARASIGPQRMRRSFRDLLINVTRFFRDRHSFDVLYESAIKKLMEDAEGTEEGVRVWIPGCSSGEEAYTIAISVCRGCESIEHAMQRADFRHRH